MTSDNRARDLGIVIGDYPTGPHNAITDVTGVRVGHTTLIEGDGPRVTGQGPVRTGVTVVIPRDEPWRKPLFAAPHRLNGNGELTGLEWMRESGTLTSFIAITNTHSVGVVRDALVAYEATRRGPDELFFALPVVGETWDGMVNDINGFHVKREHVLAAIESASAGPVVEGNVGGGTGMTCHGFKGGIGTSSRVLPAENGGYTVGVLVQANHGNRDRLVIDSVPVGRHLGADVVPTPGPGEPSVEPGTGSIIIVVATDAPLLPTQCARVAQRAALGVARTGGAGENGSGDIFVCFSTGNDTIPAGFDPDDARIAADVKMLSNDHISKLFYATIEATEEAIINAMLAAETMVGANGHTIHALPHDQLTDVMRRYGRTGAPAA